MQEIPNTGDPRRVMPIAFFGPDRAVVTDGNDRGQSIEFVRDHRQGEMGPRGRSRRSAKPPSDCLSTDINHGDTETQSNTL